jgi:UDP-N-acetylglucosamine--N-acetylmuramyl-(pentapeptide) pyrophosphoryl-undecaprenol N-acetylglucosamine transferase
MPQSQTILLAGGGTGGHLYPGISVAQALREQAPHISPLFLCTTREIDRMILEPTGFAFTPQPIVPLSRSIGGLLRFWRGWRETKDMVRKILSEHQPSAVLGLGGYAAGVAVKVAAMRKIPTAILNPDVIPGKANQFLMRHVSLLCCQFPQTQEHVPPHRRDRIHVTGCPVRSEIRTLPPREQAAARLGLEARLHTLVITGASQGALTVNEAVLETLREMKLQGWQILHLSGKEHAEAVRRGYRELELPAAVVDFTPAMADVWAVADLAISRAGASSCAELTACGIASILLPYPFHADMHQRANAKVLSDAGAAILIDDTKDHRKTAAALRPALESLLYDVPRRSQMAQAARSLGKPDAADEVARALLSLAPA